MVPSLLVAIAVMLAAATVGGKLASYLSLPRVVGEMAAGPVLGASVVGRAWPGLERVIFPADIARALELCVLVIVVFYVGDVGARTQERRSLASANVIALATAVGAMLAFGGAGLVQLALGRYVPPNANGASFLLFAASALLITAVPVLARILDELGLLQTRVGGLALSLAVADDVVAWGLVALAVAVSGKGGLALGFGASICLVAVALALSLTQRRRGPFTERQTIAARLGLLALVAAAAHRWGGIVVIAAFVVGALLRTGDLTEERADHRRGGVLLRALVSIYIVWAGLSVDFAGIARSRYVIGIGVVVGAAVATKLLATAAVARPLGLRASQYWGLAILRNTRGLTELIVLSIGRQAGIVSPELYTIFFSMAVLTTAGSGLAVKLLARREAFWRRMLRDPRTAHAEVPAPKLERSRLSSAAIGD
jgi:Kef-type K+ transport system membrane component KefB